MAKRVDVIRDCWRCPFVHRRDTYDERNYCAHPDMPDTYRWLIGPVELHGKKVITIPGSCPLPDAEDEDGPD